MNGGACEENPKDDTFTCTCLKSYFGAQCENGKPQFLFFFFFFNSGKKKKKSESETLDLLNHT